MRLMHEFEELVDDRLEKLPMRFEESWVLADNVHDVGRADGLVVFASLHLSQAQQVLDHSDKESLFRLLVWKGQLSAWECDKRDSSLIAPEIDPIAQHRVFRLFHDHSEPSICLSALGRSHEVLPQ